MEILHLVGAIVFFVVGFRSLEQPLMKGVLVHEVLRDGAHIQAIPYLIACVIHSVFPLFFFVTAGVCIGRLYV